MRIIFLNSWFGKAGKPFFDFIKRESSKTDIFCFMEVTPELYSNLSSLLKEFNGLYKKGLVLKMEGILCGQAIFLAKGIETGKNGKVSIYRQSSRDIGFMQFAELKIGKKKIWLGSIHGKTLPGDKFDTSVRLRQSEKIIDFFAGKKAPKIFGGDFNLMPDTKSIGLFEKAGYRNLIKDFGIKNTRNELSWQQFNNVQHFADYVFTSKDIKINKFEVPYNEISDHLPQILDFEVNP
ncbi:MAG: hypothetical protein NT162_01880 [Candidatus Woesebacteria bacterium]|nr:hypothetical protein [Candidatus Woesebacteria bacterium]